MFKLLCLILTTFLLLSSFNSELCSEGCLSCSSDGTCNLCNFYNNMFLTEEIAFNRYDNPLSFRGDEPSPQCQFNFLDNCLRTHPQGKCKECRKGYTVNKYTGNCEVEEISDLVDHCIDYAMGLCVKCGNAYILRDNVCLKSFTYREITETTTDAQGVETSSKSLVSFDEDLPNPPAKIFECEVYEVNTSSRCRKCSKGHYVTEDFKCRKYLTSSTFDPNCASVSTFKCFECDSGYALLNNAFLDRSFSDGQDQFPEIYRFLKNNVEGYFESLSNNSCIPNSIEGCLEYSGITTCKVCDNSKNYFLIEDKSCLQITPEFTIPHCQEYLNKTKCSLCSKFFKINSTNTQCINPKYIENCKTHIRSSDLDLCGECNEDFFLSTPDTCLPRTKDSPRYQNCTTVDPSSDSCKTCAAEHVKSPASLLCLPLPTGCAQYIPNEDPAAEDPFHKCVECSPLFYLDPANKTCTPIAVANCRIYDPATQKCTECLPTFYLETQDSGEVVCSAHSTELYPDCKIFSPSIKDKCLFCGENCNVFEIKSHCVRREISDMCEWYDSKGETCVACFDGFELSSDGDCRMLDVRKNCLVGTGEFCWICLEGYEREFSGSSLTGASCLKKDISISKNCDLSSGKSTSILFFNNQHVHSVNEGHT